jgi:uncharacterized phage protein gp47/JayE
VSGYLRLPLEVDPDELLRQSVARIAARIPGYRLVEGNPASAILEEDARLNADTRLVAVDVAAAAFRALLIRLYRIAPLAGAAAFTTTTWTMRNADGYTVEAGTVIAFRRADGTLVPFETVDEFTVPAGSQQTPPGAVVVRAVDNGAAQNGVGGVGVLISPAYAFVSSIVADSPAAGGADAETDAEFLDRGADLLTAQAPRPILPTDAALLARSIPGVHRALAIDNYDPATGTFDNERMTAVATVDIDGNPVGMDTRADVADALEAQREVNFVFHVIDPTYTTLDVTFAAVARRGFEPADVQERAIAAATTHLSPGRHAGGAEQPPTWRRETTVRYLEVATVINNVDGVDHITDLTLNGGTADVPLDGVAPLPASVDAGTTISGTVTAP